MNVWTYVHSLIHSRIFLCCLVCKPWVLHWCFNFTKFNYVLRKIFFFSVSLIQYFLYSHFLVRVVVAFILRNALLVAWLRSQFYAGFYTVESVGDCSVLNVILSFQRILRKYSCVVKHWWSQRSEILDSVVHFWPICGYILSVISWTSHILNYLLNIFISAFKLFIWTRFSSLQSLRRARVCCWSILLFLSHLRKSFRLDESIVLISSKYMILLHLHSFQIFVLHISFHFLFLKILVLNISSTNILEFTLIDIF